MNYYELTDEKTILALVKVIERLKKEYCRNELLQEFFYIAEINGKTTREEVKKLVSDASKDAYYEGVLDGALFNRLLEEQYGLLH